MTLEQLKERAVQEGLRAYIAKDNSCIRIGYISNHIEITAVEWSKKDAAEQDAFYNAVYRALKGAKW